MTITNVTIDELKGIKCKNLTISGRVRLLTNVRVDGVTRFTGTSVEEIGRGCVFAKIFDASGSSLRAIAPETQFGLHVYLTDCPIETFNVPLIRGSLLAKNSKLTTITTKSVGFDGSGKPLDNLAKDKDGGLGALDISGTKIKVLPDGLKVADNLDLPSTVKVLPSGLRASKIWMKPKTVKVLPKDIKFDIIYIVHSTREYLTFHDEAYLARTNSAFKSAGKTATKARILKPGDEIPES